MGTALLTGCVTGRVNKRLEAGTKERQREIRKLIGQLRNEKPTTIGWAAAKKKMDADNLGLQSSRHLYEKSKSLQSKQWMTLIPRVGGFVQMSTDLASISDVESDDFNTRLIANFSIPNPFNFYSGLYSAALQEVNASWSHELDQRRAFSELYSAFLDAEILRKERELFDRKWKLGLHGNKDNTAAMLENYEREGNALTRRENAHRVNVNRLFNTPGGNWTLRGSIPRISYETKYRNLEIGEDFGKLAMNLYAVQVETAILSTKRIKFQQWPALSFGLSAPPLYVSDRDSDFSADNINLFTGLSKTYEFSDFADRERIADAEFRLKVTRDRVLAAMEREAIRLDQLKKTYQLNLRQRAKLKAEARQIEKRQSALAEVVIMDLQRKYEIQAELLLVERQIKFLELQYLLWDEVYWKS